MSSVTSDVSEQQSQVNNEDLASDSNKAHSVLSQTTANTTCNYEESKEFNKRLLVSLGMLLPAVAAIIGKSNLSSFIFTLFIHMIHENL